MAERVRDKHLADADGPDDGDVPMLLAEAQRDELVEERASKLTLLSHASSRIVDRDARAAVARLLKSIQAAAKISALHELTVLFS